MEEKKWRSYPFVVNGLTTPIQYNEETVQGLFVPFLRRMTRLQESLGRRVIVFMAALPGVGKSTLATMFELLSRDEEGIAPVQAIGLDGFHHHADYLQSHYFQREGERLPLAAIKGSPETFDLAHLRDKLAALQKQDIKWPVYDRSIHDVIEEAEQVDKPLIIFEGNWLLLREQGWQDLRPFADYTLFITASPADLRERLIARKVLGGKTRAEAEAFYESSDKLNAERVLGESAPADETWQMLRDGDYRLQEAGAD